MCPHYGPRETCRPRLFAAHRKTLVFALFARPAQSEVGRAAFAFMLLLTVEVAVTLSMSHRLRYSDRPPPLIAQFRTPLPLESCSLPGANPLQADEDRLTPSASRPPRPPPERDAMGSDEQIPNGTVSASCARDGASPSALATERTAPPVGMISTPGADFGPRLAAAARSQVEELVIYTARYRRLTYPMGDVAPLHGACTDVVIRAYRALGIDLQELVHRADVGTGDANIDHRRTETLRRFFARYGAALPVTDFPEDYQPGDIVTYYRPFSRVSRSHIAIVSDVLAPTARPMIVHNRGWGPQLEDALFVDRITGHYRFAPRAKGVIAGTTSRTGANAATAPQNLVRPARARREP
jgi:uncharacterized protein